MRRRAAALRGVVQLAGIGLRVRDELLDAVHRHLGIDQQHVWDCADHRDGDELVGVVGEFRVQQVINHQWRRRAREQRVAIRVGTEHGVGTNVAGGARPVLDDHGLAPARREFFGDGARQEIGAATRREGDDDAHRFRGPLLRPGGESKQARGKESGETHGDANYNEPMQRSWPAEGATRVPYWVYQDEDLYREEQRRIFHGPTWNYLCLEAELPEPGSFITTFVGEMPVVVARDMQGAVHAFENRCAHRGALIAMQARGRAERFNCIYHNWTYDHAGNLTSVAFRRGIA